MPHAEVEARLRRRSSVLNWWRAFGAGLAQQWRPRGAELAPRCSIFWRGIDGFLGCGWRGRGAALTLG